MSRSDTPTPADAMALYARGEFNLDRVSTWAGDWLANGFDGPYLRQLAAQAPGEWISIYLVARALLDAGVTLPTVQVSDLEYGLLEDGSEDYTGLWSAGFAARPDERDVPSDAAIAEAKAALLRLLREGWVDLYLLIGDNTNENFHRIPATESEAMLSQRKYWDSETTMHEPSVWYLNTDAGDAAFALAGFARHGTD